MSLNIDYDGLERAMGQYDPTDETAYFFDTRTGEVLVVDKWMEEQAREFDDPGPIKDSIVRLAWYLLWRDGEIGRELPESQEITMAEQAEAYLARYLPVPTADSHEDYQDMVAFTETVTDLHLRQLLDVALTGKGAFRRFKDVLLGYPAERERWFAFTDQRLRERIDEWLYGQGILSDRGANEFDIPVNAGEQVGRQAQKEDQKATTTVEIGTLVLLNFAHPLTEKHIQNIEAITSQTVERIIDIPSQIDPSQPLIPQVITLADQAGLSSTEWQTLPLLINPPSLNFVAVTLLAELHGRCGYFPACLRMRPVPDSVPPRYEVAEVINLQAVRDTARVKR